ncbi:MAG: hypothetical protein H6Q88_1118 [Anaeromyxobacteraceae bacterium]|nr:hypothetical protein [Anaeromyxobacteraceae bacterium]
MRTSRAVVAASSLLLAIGFAPPALGVSTVDGGLGGYLLNATSQVRVSPFPASEQAGDVRVTLERARTPGHVSVRLESRGYSCVLDAARSRSGDLAFSTPASCPVDVRRPDARGRIDAQLRSGHGKVRDGWLTLDLRFDVSGTISTRVSGRTFTLFQSKFTVPEGWTPAVPIRGTVTSGGSGARQGALP